jgi:predicted nuclease with TOPRIM domain
VTGSENGAEANEELLKLIAALEDAKKMYMNEKDRCSELEEELTSMSNENRALQTRLSVNANDEMKSIHEELSILEEVR